MTRSKPKLNWPVASFFLLTTLAAVTLVPLWGFTHGYSGWAWLFLLVFLALGGLSITAGYHRMWAHRTYKGRWPLRLFFAVLGAQALQNSILVWCARHRVHHRHVDDTEHDPHSIKSGFWHAHIGWMLRDWPNTEPDYSQVPDLQRDWVVNWQHRHYWKLVWATNLGLPLAAGWLVGDVIGVLLLAGVLRLVLSHHCTFFINSLAHTWGNQPYSDENSSRDNGLIATVTWGEGYHNFHHAFQGDYRNGVRWWHFDPGKWLISVCAWTGLAYDLRRTPRFKIQRARLLMEFNRLQERLESRPCAPTWREVLEREYQQFRETVSQWQAVQAEKVQAGTEALRDRWRRTDLRTRFKELEFRLKMQRRRLRTLYAAAVV